MEAFHELFCRGSSYGGAARIAQDANSVDVDIWLSLDYEWCSRACHVSDEEPKDRRKRCTVVEVQASLGSFVSWYKQAKGREYHIQRNIQVTIADYPRLNESLNATLKNVQHMLTSVKT